jgi:hypothetical protein
MANITDKESFGMGKHGERVVLPELQGTTREAFLGIALPREFDSIRAQADTRLDIPENGNGNGKIFATYTYLHSIIQYSSFDHIYARPDSKYVLRVDNEGGYR